MSVTVSPFMFDSGWCNVNQEDFSAIKDYLKYLSVEIKFAHLRCSTKISSVKTIECVENEPLEDISKHGHVL